METVWQHVFAVGEMKTNFWTLVVTLPAFSGNADCAEPNYSKMAQCISTYGTLTLLRQLYEQETSNYSSKYQTSIVIHLLCMFVIYRG